MEEEEEEEVVGEEEEMDFRRQQAEVSSEEFVELVDTSLRNTTQKLQCCLIVIMFSQNSPQNFVSKFFWDTLYMLPKPLMALTILMSLIKKCHR